MMTLKGKLKVGLILFGIATVAYGLIQLNPFLGEETVRMRGAKDLYSVAARGGAFSWYAPHLLAVGAIALLGAFILRDK
jgi:hypothetical protein